MPEILADILNNINGRGWNLYRIEGNEKLPYTISRGPANKLTVGQYLVMPAIRESRNPEAVSERMQLVLRGGEYPRIVRGDISPGIMYLELFQDEIVIKERQDYRYSYEDFLKALDTLPIHFSED